MQRNPEVNLNIRLNKRRKIMDASNQPGAIQTDETKFLRLCQFADVEPHITFIGGGNMCQAIVKGFLKSGFMSPQRISVSTPRPTESLKLLKVTIGTSNREFLSKNKHGIFIISVKPHILSQLASECKDLLRDAGLLVSVLAGVSTETIRKQLEDPDWEKDKGIYPPIIRILPNTPASIGCGATVFCRDKNTSDSDANLVQSLMETVGTCDEIPEKIVGAAGALSGCGPAFVYTMIDALSDGALKMGVPRQLATRLAAQTVMGAAKMVLDTGSHPGELKNQVCSPGGTTIHGVAVLEERGVRGALISAVEAASHRSDQLGSAAAALGK